LCENVSLNAAAHDGYVVFQNYDPATGTVFVVVPVRSTIGDGADSC